MGSPVTNSVSNDRKLLRELLESVKEQDLRVYMFRSVPERHNKKPHLDAIHKLIQERSALVSSLPPKIRSAPLDSTFSSTTTTTTTTTNSNITDPTPQPPNLLPTIPSPTQRIFGRAALQGSQPRRHHMRMRGTTFALADAPARGRKRKSGKRLFRGKVRKAWMESGWGKTVWAVDLTGETTGEEDKNVKREGGEGENEDEGVWVGV